MSISSFESHIIIFFQIYGFTEINGKLPRTFDRGTNPVDQHRGYCYDSIDTQQMNWERTFSRKTTDVATIKLWAQADPHPGQFHGPKSRPLFVVSRTIIQCGSISLNYFYVNPMELMKQQTFFFFFWNSKLLLYICCMPRTELGNQTTELWDTTPVFQGLTTYLRCNWSHR